MALSSMSCRFKQTFQFFLLLLAVAKSIKYNFMTAQDIADSATASKPNTQTKR